MYDLAIIGGGPGGYVAAERAGSAGLSVILFEKTTGTVPFSVLLASSISQDGHASLPLLAESKRSFVKAKIVNALVAAVCGFLCYFIGF